MPLIFAVVAASISHFLATATTFSCCCSNCFVFFLSLALALCCFFLVELRWLVAYFLFFSVFLFLYFLNLWTWKLIQASYFRHHGCRNNFRFPFSLLTLKSKLFLLYKTRVAMRFPAKITSSCIRLPYLLLSYFTLVYLWYGRTGKRTVSDYQNLSDG